jgi:hypothetical protein
MSVIVKIENWLAKSVWLKKISSTYRIEKFKTEKIMPPPANHLGGHGRLG